MEKKDFLFISIVSIVAICAIFCIFKISTTPTEYVISTGESGYANSQQDANTPTGMAVRRMVDDSNDDPMIIRNTRSIPGLANIRRVNTLDGEKLSSLGIVSKPAATSNPLVKVSTPLVSEESKPSAAVSQPVKQKTSSSALSKILGILGLTKKCDPICTGKKCGDDGCGGTCGSCLSGYECSDGLCLKQDGHRCSVNSDCLSGLCEKVQDGPEKVCRSSKCGNGICDVDEYYLTCPDDCKCGNKICESKENYWNCPEDCLNQTYVKPCAKETEMPTPIKQCCSGLKEVYSIDTSGNPSDPICTFCGNAECGPGETIFNCEIDCPCGNGKCDPGEDWTRCIDDCPKPIISQECYKEGEGYPCGRMDITTKCCAGLTGINSPDSQGSKCPPGLVCTYCGNGYCGVGENSYNCPADCPSVVSCAEQNKITEGKVCCDSALTQIQYCENALICSRGETICTRCGNGECDSYEFNVNCPQDCHDVLIGSADACTCTAWTSDPIDPDTLTSSVTRTCNPKGCNSEIAKAKFTMIV